MIDYDASKETIEKIQEIDEKLHSNGITAGERTKLMYEQMLRGLYLNQFN